MHYKGPLRPGEFVLHSCDNPPCCNPDHLSAGTHTENMRQKSQRGRSADMRGHRNSNVKLDHVLLWFATAMLADGMSQKEVAAILDVHPVTVSKAVRGKKGWLLCG
jgi:hypothetical protein